MWNCVLNFGPNFDRNLAYFHHRSSGFWDTDRFSKLPYLGMKLGHCPKCQKLHIYSLCTPTRSKLSLFSLYGQRFPGYGPIFKIAIYNMIYGHETWQLAKVPEVAHILSLYPRGSIWQLSPSCKFHFIFLYRHPLLSYTVTGHSETTTPKVQKYMYLISTTLRPQFNFVSPHSLTFSSYWPF